MSMVKLTGFHKLSLSVAVVTATVLLVKAPPSPHEERKAYTSNVPMSSEEAKINGVCISFSASMVSEAFQGLKRSETTSGVQFTRSKKPVTNFPELIDVQLWAYPYLCAASPSKRPDKDLGADILDSLVFESSWKRGMETHNTPIISAVRKRFPVAHRWLFLIQLRGGDTPLTDHLILIVKTSNGALIARLSGQL
jgi:hypothetical protein